MPSETSAGAIIFRREDDGVKYLLLHYHFKSEYWDFVKGNTEEGESEEETVIREIKEETGIADIKFVKDFKEKVKWFYKREEKTVFKQAAYFLAETKTKEVRLSEEHIGFDWLPYEEAYARITFKNSKEILRKADEYLKKNEKPGTLKDFF